MKKTHTYKIRRYTRNIKCDTSIGFALKCLVRQAKGGALGIGRLDLKSQFLCF